MHNANLYYKNNCAQQKLAADCLKNHGSKIKWKENNNRILDVGCGEGTVTAMLKKFSPWNATMFGCDINKNMVNLAIENHSDEHTTFSVLDIAGDIPEELVGNFSHVFSFFALNWVPDQKTSFNNIFHLLEEDGECFLAIVTYTPIFDVYRHLAQSDKWKTWVYNVERYISPYHDSLEPIQDIKNLMKRTGFDNIDIAHEEVYYIFDNIEALKRTLHAINPFIIPPEKSDAFWEDYLELWKKFDGLDNLINEEFMKNIKYKFKLMTVHARKPKNA